MFFDYKCFVLGRYPSKHFNTVIQKLFSSLCDEVIINRIDNVFALLVAEVIDNFLLLAESSILVSHQLKEMQLVGRLIVLVALNYYHFFVFGDHAGRESCLYA